jgi:DNA polymerase V
VAFTGGDVWGVGSASAAKLRGLAIKTAAQLRDLDPRRARQLLTIVGELLVMELPGIACLPVELVPPRRKGSAVTRSFGAPVATLSGMLEAVAPYAARAGEKLRRHGLAARRMAVFIRTSAFNEDPRYSASTTVALPESSDDMRDLIAAAKQGVRRIWKECYRFARAGC